MTMTLDLLNGSLLHHYDQGLLWSTVVLARTGTWGYGRRRPFIPYLGVGLLITSISSTLGDIFWRHMPLSVDYLFEVGLFFIGAALTARSRRLITKGATVLTCCIGGMLFLVWGVYIIDWLERGGEIILSPLLDLLSLV
jgi:hypothetical protein